MNRPGYSRPVSSPLSGFAVMAALILSTIPATGEVVVYRAPENEALSTDYQVWVDGQQLIDMWVQQGMTEWSGTIDLVAGQRYSIEMWMYEHDGGAGAELRWSSPSTPKQIIPQAALSPRL